MQRERDYGDGSLQVAYVYGYNGNGIRVWKQDMLAQQEYRYVCRIGCGGVPMRVYDRALSGGSWGSAESYLPAENSILVQCGRYFAYREELGTSGVYYGTVYDY